MTATISRKQRELLATARAIALGKTPRQIVREQSIHPAAVLHYRRTLRHLRVTAEDVTGTEDVDLLLLFKQRRREQKQRTRAARKAKGGAA